MLVSQEVYSAYVKLPHPDITPLEIAEKKRFARYFSDCLGAVDGSLLDAHVPAKDAPRFRSRKGRISINLFAACTFSLQYCYLLSGWEGSAADS